MVVTTQRDMMLCLFVLYQTAMVSAFTSFGMPRQMISTRSTGKSPWGSGGRAPQIMFANDVVEEELLEEDDDDDEVSSSTNVDFSNPNAVTEGVDLFPQFLDNEEDEYDERTDEEKYEDGINNLLDFKEELLSPYQKEVLEEDADLLTKAQEYSEALGESYDPTIEVNVEQQQPRIDSVKMSERGNLPPGFESIDDDLEDYGTNKQATGYLEKDMERYSDRIDFLDVDKALDELEPEQREDILMFDLKKTNDEAKGGHDQDDVDDNRRQFLFDYQFNVTNLLLASFKVNPDAPAVKEEWMDALRDQNKYESVRLMEFNFTWDDVDDANVTELEEYWRLSGLDRVPKPSPKELPNVVSWDEGPTSFADESMLALEKWMEEVYEDEDDNMLEEDAAETEEFTDEKLNPYEKDVNAFEANYADEPEEWKRQFYSRQEYEQKPDDTDEAKAFCGHLVIACSPSEEDMELAEKLTKRMEMEFGAKVFVETRVYGHAKPADNLYEIWIESWEIELLHSKRKAVFDREWKGARELDQENIDNLVQEVAFQISDDARYSYRLDDFPRTE